MSSTDENPFLWFALSLFLTSAMIVGLLSGSVFGTNVALGLCWISIVLSWLRLVALSDVDEMRELRLRWARRPRYRLYVSSVLDVAVILLLAGFGHWWTFAFFTLDCAIQVMVDQKASKELAKRADTGDKP